MIEGILLLLIVVVIIIVLGSYLLKDCGWELNE